MTSSSSKPLPEIPAPHAFWTEPGPTVADLRDTHGDVFRLRLRSGRGVVCATGVEAHRTFLVEHLEHLSNHDGWFRLIPSPAGIGKGIIFMDGAEHRWFRKALAPAFTTAAIAARLPAMQDIVRRRIGNWPRDGVIGLYDEISAIAFQIAAATVFGTKPSDDVRELHELYRDLMLIRPQGVLERRARIGAAVLPIIRARMQEPADDMISHVIRSGGPEGSLGEDDLLSHANMLIVAGHFTASPLTSFLLLMLSTHPQVLAELRARQPDTDDLDMATILRMQALDAALAEAERLFPPIPHLPRMIARDTEFQGHCLRAGELLFCSVAGTHHDAKIFAQPRSFAPDRFAPPRSERAAQPLALAGFNVGPRRCLGAMLGQVMIKVMVHHILRRFVLAPEPGAFAPSVSFPMLHPTNEVPVRVTARK
jgi:retinoid hydroxylase